MRTSLKSCRNFLVLDHQMNSLTQKPIQHELFRVVSQVTVLDDKTFRICKREFLIEASRLSILVWSIPEASNLLRHTSSILPTTLFVFACLPSACLKIGWEAEKGKKKSFFFFPLFSTSLMCRYLPASSDWIKEELSSCLACQCHITQSKAEFTWYLTRP